MLKEFCTSPLCIINFIALRLHPVGHGDKISLLPMLRKMFTFALINKTLFRLEGKPVLWTGQELYPGGKVEEGGSVLSQI